ncbi:substrate-binding periplasmic protein [Marinobacter sp. JSM 1782161]|uniref:substrate-binding periplasmic protein n=1 Tax=Marinobacter sp. JSM 1782161 TaxID=2685906 RepID=UPI0014041B63|nr:transporter substrate-binding domain-containing protein [Marinobacter sp. JSM 1782161]
MHQPSGSGTSGSISGRLLLALSGLLLTLFTASAAHAEGPFRIFTENYPPYNASTTGQSFAHNEDDITGICTDMVKAMMANTDIDYEMKMRDWSFAYKWVQEHANHGLFCTARTDEREDDFQWVGPLASIRWTLFAAPDSDIELDSLDDARQYRIAGYKGDVMSDYLIEQGMDVLTSRNSNQNPQRLALGQVDLWVTDGLVGPLIAEEQADITGLRPVLVFRETPMYLAVSNQTDPAVVAELQAALDKARDDGTIDAIEKRYR